MTVKTYLRKCSRCGTEWECTGKLHTKCGENNIINNTQDCICFDCWIEKIENREMFDYLNNRYTSNCFFKLDETKLVSYLL